jgi:hypothetical protein
MSDGSNENATSARSSVCIGWSERHAQTNPSTTKQSNASSRKTPSGMRSRAIWGCIHAKNSLGLTIPAVTRSPYLEEIVRLDPERDHVRIVHLDVCYEFPFDTTRALEFALFRTFAVPSVARTLASGGEFELRAQRRYDDTDLILSEIAEHGYDSDRGRRAIRRMNRIHGRFEISNDDFLYVLSTFVHEPIRWNERFGWRPLVEQEKLASFYFWRAVGRRMAIKDIPAHFDELERFNREYEQRHFHPTGEGQRVARATRDMFLAWFPGLPRRLGARALYAVMDEPLLTAFGFEPPSRPLRRAVKTALRLRARVVRALPPRRRPRLRTELRHRTYPDGYRIEELGPA